MSRRRDAELRAMECVVELCSGLDRDARERVARYVERRLLYDKSAHELMIGLLRNLNWISGELVRARDSGEPASPDTLKRWADGVLPKNDTETEVTPMTTLDLAAIEAHDARMGAAWWCDRAHELLAAVRTLEAERDTLQAQSDVWERKSKNNGLAAAIQTERLDEAETRVTTLRARVTALEALLAHAGSYVWVAEQNGGQGLAEAEALSKAIAAALLTKEGV